MTPHEDRGGFLKHGLHRIVAAPTVPVQCFALLACLVNASEGHNRQATYHAQRFLGAELGVSPTTIRRWTGHLVELGLLEVTVHKAYPDPETGRFTRLLTKYRPKWAGVRAAMAQVIAAKKAKGQVAPSAANGSSTPLLGGRTRARGRWRGSKPPPPPPPNPDCASCDGTGLALQPDHRYGRCPCIQPN